MKTGRMRKRSAAIGLVWGVMACIAFGLQVQLGWDPPPSNVDGTPATDVAGYKVRQGSASGHYDTTLNVGNSLEALLPDLKEGATYYIVVSAYDTSGIESDFSSELVWTAPDFTPPQITLPIPLILKASTNGWALLPDMRPLASVTDNCSEAANIVVTQSPAPQTQLAVGTTPITLLARDQAGNVGSCPVSVTVVSADTHGPQIVTLDDRSLKLGETLEMTVRAVELDNLPLSLAAENLPRGASFEDNGDGSGTLRWTPTSSSLGDHPIMFTASNGSLVDTGTMVAHVSSFAVTEPAAAEVVRMGRELRVSWTGALRLEAVNIDLWVGTNCVMSLASNLPAGAAEMTWSTALPAVLPPNGDCMVRVTDVRNPADYACSPFFAILGTSHNDFNGDGQSDMGLFYSRQGLWSVRDAADTNVLMFSENWGFKDCVPAPGDYDGDGACDLAVFYPKAGTWYIRSRVQNTNLVAGLCWGFKGCVPVPGDYDGDGIFDLAVFNPKNATWYIRSLKSDVPIANGLCWGFKGCVPVPGDYDGDGIFDLAVFNPKNATWQIRAINSDVPIASGLCWGFKGCVPVPADYDSDGKSEPAVYLPKNGTWFVRNPRPGLPIVLGQSWGFKGCVPVPGDYDGDGNTDLAVYWPRSGTWYIRLNDVSGTACAPIKWGNSKMAPL